MKLTSEQLDELVDYLQGTCLPIDAALNQCFDIELYDVENEMEMCARIDNAIFECAECGWWCEAGDWWVENPNAANGDICSSCAPPEEDE